MKKDRLPFRDGWNLFGMPVVLLVVFGVFSLTVPYFFTGENMVGLGLSVSMVGMVACSMLFCLASGDFDLSVEGVVVLSGVVCAVVIGATGSLFLGIFLGIAAGAVVGAVNGVIIAKFRINALITTLAMLYVVRGFSFIVSNGSAVGIADESFFQLGNGTLFGIPNPIWIMAAFFMVFGILLNHTAFGRETLAIGGDREAARMAGIDVDRVKILIFTLQGLVAGCAGIVLASRMTSGQPNSSAGFALDVIAACLLGGVSHTNGTGTIRGVVIGVLLLGMVQNVMNLLGIPTFYQYLTKGTILLFAVVIDKLNRGTPVTVWTFQMALRPPMTRSTVARSAQILRSRKPASSSTRRKPGI